MKAMGAEVTDISELLGGGAGAPSRRARKLWVAAGILAALGVAGGLLWNARSTGSAVRYETQAARRGDLSVTVSATGNLEPTDQVQVGSELSGTVRSVEVDANDRVKAGQVLARLDTSKLEAQARQLDATLTSARAKVLQAQVTVRETAATAERLRRLKEATGGQTPSQADLDAAEATLDRARSDEASARAAVVQAEAALAATRTDLSKATIRSPINGVVLTRSVEPGQTVAASLQAPVLFLLAKDLTKMQLEVSVDEADVAKVRKDQPASFTVDAFPGRTFQARIERVDYGSKTTGGVVTYGALLDVENRDLALRPGMTATADVCVQEVKDVLLVPNAALRFSPSAASAGAKKPQGAGLVSALLPRPPGQRRQANRGPSPERKGGQPQVWTLREGAPARIPVTVGATDGVWTEITAGDVAPGTLLVTDAAGGKP